MEKVSKKDTMSLTAQYFELLLRVSCFQIPCCIQILLQKNLIKTLHILDMSTTSCTFE